MEQSLLLFTHQLISSKRTSGNWFFDTYYFLFLAFPIFVRKTRQKTNGTYYHTSYPPNLLYPLLLVLSLATIIASSNWNYLILFSPRKSHGSRTHQQHHYHLNHCFRKILRHEHQRANLYSTRSFQQIEPNLFDQHFSLSAPVWPRLFAIADFHPA